MVVDSFTVDPGHDTAPSFDLTVSGIPSGPVTLEIDPSGLPVESHQTVRFPAGRGIIPWWVRGRGKVAMLKEIGRSKSRGAAIGTAVGAGMGVAFAARSNKSDGEDENPGKTA